MGECFLQNLLPSFVIGNSNVNVHCSSPSECNDNNDCTKDECNNNRCSYSQIPNCEREQVVCSAITVCSSCSKLSTCKWITCGQNPLSSANFSYFSIDNFTSFLFTTDIEIVEEMKFVSAQIAQLQKESSLSNELRATIVEIQIGSLYLFYITSESNVFAVFSFTQSKCISGSSQISEGCQLNSNCLVTTTNTLSQEGASIGGTVAVSGAVSGGGACFVITFVLICYRRKKVKTPDDVLSDNNNNENQGLQHQENLPNSENPLFK